MVVSVTFMTAIIESAPFTGQTLGVPRITTSRSRTLTVTTASLLAIGTGTPVQLGRWMSTSPGRDRWCRGRRRSLRLEADEALCSTPLHLRSDPANQVYIQLDLDKLFRSKLR